MLSFCAPSEDYQHLSKNASYKCANRKDNGDFAAIHHLQLLVALSAAEAHLTPTLWSNTLTLRLVTCFKGWPNAKVLKPSPHPNAQSKTQDSKLETLTKPLARGRTRCVAVADWQAVLAQTHHIPTPELESDSPAGAST